MRAGINAMSLQIWESGFYSVNHVISVAGWNNDMRQRQDFGQDGVRALRESLLVGCRARFHRGRAEQRKDALSGVNSHTMNLSGALTRNLSIKMNCADVELKLDVEGHGEESLDSVHSR